MSVLEKVALFLCLLFSGLQFFSKGNAVPPASTAGSAVEEIRTASDPANQQPGIVSVIYGKFSVADVPGNNFFHLSVDGIEYKPGQMTTAGTVLSATASHIHIRDNQGNDTFIYPRKDVFEPQGYRDVQANREFKDQVEIGGQE